MSYCGAKGGYDFINLKNRIKKLPGVKPYKLDSFYRTVELKCCLPHDNRADIGGGIIAFIKSNYVFALDLISIMRFTTSFGRFTIFLLAFIGTSVGGIRTFNWTKIL